MNAPNGPDWISYLEFSLIALVTALSRGLALTDPGTGRLAINNLIQAVATAMVIGVGAAAAQERWSQPFWLTGAVSAGLALVGLPIITTLLRTAVQAAAKSQLGGPGVKSDAPPSDKS